ncbi:MAG: Na+/H+ antiporter subunit D [Blastocatellia bacterium]|nr:Na+/H+ antiporter subunit D [Blastocatellia bacterium]
MALILPILIPLATATVGFLAWRGRQWQRGLGVVGSVALLVASINLLVRVWQHGPQVLWVGNWPAPFGIALIADLLSAIMVVLAATIGVAVALFSLAHMDPARETFGYYPLSQILLMGVCGAFLTGDLFNLYVWFEVMLMASFVLLALGGERAQLEGAIKYVTLNLMASALFLTAVGLLYGLVGTLNMADLAQRLRPLPPSGAKTAIAFLLLTAFGIKAAIFPLFFWLPASYHTPPVAVSAIFAGLLTKVGVYALLRVFTLIFPDQGHAVILIVSGLTMLTGVLGALAQNEFRRILSFHIISQIGYMIMGLGLLTTAGLAGSIFYIIHHIIVKTNLFLTSGLAHAVQGSFDLNRLGGLYRTHPSLAILFLIPALSLAGLPPLSGFFAKLLLVQAGLQAGRWIIVAVALGVSLLTLLSMMKIWTEAFWKPAADDPPASSAPAPAPSTLTPLAPSGVVTARWGILSSAGLALLTILIGLGAEFVLALAEAAAEQLQDPDLYISTMFRSRS